MRKSTRLACLAAMGLAAGCVTKGEGDKIWAEIRAIQAQNNEILKSLNENKTKLVALMRSADEKTATLNNKIEQAESILRRSNVDFFQQLQQLQTEMSKTAGRLEQNERGIDVLRRDFDAYRADAERRIAKLAAPPPPPPPKEIIPSDPTAAYNQGASELAAAQYDKAVKTFLEVLQKFPQHPRMEDVQFGLAEAYLGMRDYKRALAEYSRFYQDFGTSSRAAEALFKVAQCYEALGDLKTAVLSLKVITKKFKKSTFAKDAKKLMKQLQKRI